MNVRPFVFVVLGIAGLTGSILFEIPEVGIGSLALVFVFAGFWRVGPTQLKALRGLPPMVKQIHIFALTISSLLWSASLIEGVFFPNSFGLNKHLFGFGACLAASYCSLNQYVADFYARKQQRPRSR